MREIPLHDFLGLEIVRAEPGRGEARIVVSKATTNIAGVLHGGVLYALLDAVCYLGVVPLLAADENAVTHDLHVSVMRSVKVGAIVELTGLVRRRGRTVVFADGEASVNGRIVATARVTKSIVEGALGIRASGSE